MPSAADKVVSIIFQGDDRVTKTIKGVRSSLGSLETAIAGVAQPFAKIGDAVLKVDAALAALAVGGAAYSIKKFADFEDTMLKVKGVIGANAEEYERLTDLTRGLGETTRYTATEAAQGLEFLALAGFQVEEAIGALPEVLNLAQAAGMELGTTADIVTNIMAGYGVEVKDLSQASDILTGTFTNSNTSLEQLGQAFKFVGPVAKGLGLDLEETAAILGTLGNAGYQAEKGGTALRNILLALVAPAGNMGKLFKELGVNTEEMGIDLASSANALKSLGVEVKDSTGNLRPFTEIMVQVSSGLSRIQDPADRAATLVEIFGKRGGPQMAALLEQGSDAVRGLETRIRELGGVTGEIAAQMESGMGGAMRSLRSAMESVFLNLGENLAPAATDVTNATRDIFRAISSEVDAGSLDEIFDAVDAFGEDLASALETIAQNLPEAFEAVDWSGLVDAIRDLAGQFGLLFDEVDLSTAEGLSDAMQGVVDTLESLVRVTEGMVRYLDPVWDSIREGVSRFNELDNSSKIAAGEFLGAAELIAKAGVKIGLALAAIEKSGAEITNVFNAVAGAVGFVWNELEIIFSRMAQLVVNFLSAITYIPEKLSGIIPGLGGVSEGIASFRDELKVMNEELQAQVGKNSEEAVSRLAQAWSGLSGETRAAAQSVRSVGDSAEETASITSSAVGESADDIMRHVQAMMDGTAESAADGAKKVTKELEQGIPSEKDVAIKPKMDAKATEDAQKAIEALAKREERLQELEIARMEGDTERYKALMGVQEEKIKAQADTEQTALETLQEGIGESGKAITDLLGELSGMGPYSSGRAGLLKELERQVESAEKKEGLQTRLLEAQTKIAEARAERAQTGDDVMIQIDGAGLQPHLEAFMFEIVQQIQVRATEEGASFLLGV